MNNIGVFAGTFDPFTIGHYEITQRACQMFDKVYIAIADNSSGKKCKYTAEQRKEIIMLSLQGIDNVVVDIFDGFLVDYAHKVNASVIIRGLRSSVDFEYEKSLSEVYKCQDSKIETVYLISRNKYLHISSSVVRELLAFGGDIRGYVSPNAYNKIKEYYTK